MHIVANPRTNGPASARHETLLPLARAAELAGVTYNTLYGAGLRGHIRLRRMGRRILVPLRDLEEFVARAGAKGAGDLAPPESAR